MLFSIVPEWICFVVTLLFVLFSHEVGFKFGIKRRLKPGENPAEAAGAMSATSLGLLAFMLAFTFNGASNNHDLRKVLIVDEANAIRNTYRYSLALPEPYRSEVRGLLQEYISIRVKAPTLGRDKLKPALERTLAIQDELWSVALKVARQEPGVQLAGGFTDSLSRMFDLHTQRFEAALQARIPGIIWATLYLLSFITMAIIGYRIGLSGARSTFNELGIALAFSSVLLLIIFLDRPIGMLRVSQKPLLDVLGMLTAGK